MKFIDFFEWLTLFYLDEDKKLEDFKNIVNIFKDVGINSKVSRLFFA